MALIPIASPTVDRILTSLQIQKHQTNVEHVVYEKNDNIGGTWLENRYPGEPHSNSRLCRESDLDRMCLRYPVSRVHLLLCLEREHVNLSAELCADDSSPTGPNLQVAPGFGPQHPPNAIDLWFSIVGSNPILVLLQPRHLAVPGQGL